MLSDLQSDAFDHSAISPFLFNSIYKVNLKKHINLDKNFNSGNGKCWVGGFSESARFNFADSNQMLNYYRITK